MEEAFDCKSKKRIAHQCGVGQKCKKKIENPTKSPKPNETTPRFGLKPGGLAVSDQKYIKPSFSSWVGLAAKTY